MLLGHAWRDGGGQNRCYWDMHGGVALIGRWRRSAIGTCMVEWPS